MFLCANMVPPQSARYRIRRRVYATNGVSFDSLRSEDLDGGTIDAGCRLYMLVSRTDALTISRLMTQRNFGSLPVVEEDRTLVGLVSEYDLLQAMIEGRDLRKIMAVEIMSTHPVTATEEMKLEEVANLFQDRYITRVPVVRNGKLVGILARRDLLFGYTKASQYWS